LKFLHVLKPFSLACFSLEEFETAKAAFEKGKTLDSQDNSFQLWIRKCDAELGTYH